MSSERNKQVAIELFAHFSAGDVDGALAALTEDASWQIAGRPDANPSAGLYTKPKVSRLLHGMLSRLEGGLQMTVKGAIAEGDKVALEIESLGQLSDGRVYQQQYHFLIEFRGAKICAVREYLDTQHAYAIWFQPA